MPAFEVDPIPEAMPQEPPDQPIVPIRRPPVVRTHELEHLRTTPWEHQIDGFNFAMQNRGALLALRMGEGKSLCAIGVVNAVNARRTLIIGPVRALGVWPREFAAHSTRPHEVVVLTKGSAKDKIRVASNMLSLCQARGESCVIVVNYETAIRPEFRKFLLTKLWDVIVADECLPRGTMISTPDGSMPIEDLRIGDIVLGVDHATGKIVPSKVLRTFSRKTIMPLLSVNGVTMTANHPVWTTRGYVPAFAIRVLDTVATIVENISYENYNCDVRMVPSAVSNRCVRQEKTSFLRPVVLREMADVPPGIRRQSGNAEATRDVTPKHAKAPQEQSSDEEAARILELSQEPVPRSCQPREGSGIVACEGMASPEWRQRYAAAIASADYLGGDGLALRGQSPDERQTQTSEPHQDRHCGNDAQDCHRGRRTKPFGHAGESSGCSQDKVFRREWLGGAEIQKCRGLELAKFCVENNLRCDQETETFNLETETGNFIAGGLLVHNCHRMKDARGATGKLFGELSAVGKRKLGLSGTPLPHDLLDAFSIYRFLDSRIFGWSFVEFRQRYAKMNPLFPSKVDAWLNQDEFQQKMASIMFRVDEDVLHLPPYTDQEMVCDLSPKARAIYEELEAQLIVEIEAGIVTAANALVKLLRLTTCTSGFLKTEEGLIEEIDDSKERMLTDMLEDIAPSDPVVVFGWFKHDLAVIRRVAEKFGRRYGEVSGSRSDLTEHAKMPDDVDLLGVQLQSGGVGVDLTRASYGIYYSACFNWALMEQSLARLHRPGQKNHCHFYRLISEGTVDRVIYGVLAKRAALIGSVLAPTEPEIVGDVLQALTERKT